jgi:hypothetical protein
MPAVEIPTGRTTEASIAKMKETLEWLLENLNHFNVRQLYTEYCQITSEAGETQIDGPLLVMYDKQVTPVLRLKMGYDTAIDTFLFQLFDKSGAVTVSIDSNGKAVFSGSLNAATGTFSGSLSAATGTFSGNISTALDAYVGKNLHLGPAGTFDTRVIYFNDYMNITAKADSGWVIQFNCGYLDFIGAIRGSWGFTNASVSGLESSGYVKGTGISGSFTTADGKTVTVSNGLITGIS